MSDDFQSFTTQTAITQHHCVYCRRTIPAGTKYLAMAGKWQGEFYSGKGHIDCRDLWNSLCDGWGDPYEGMAWDICEVFAEAGETVEAQLALNARRGLYPHAVNRIEFRLRDWFSDVEEDMK